jgi:hypothetical protein
MRTFLTIALLLSLAVMYTGLGVWVLMLPVWAAPLLGGASSLALIAVADWILKLWAVDSADQLEG